MTSRITLALFAALICCGGTNAQTVAWITTSTGGQGDVYASLENNFETPGQSVLAVDAQGNAFLGGAVRNGRNWDFLVVKFSSSGERLWTASYGGAASTDDRALALAVDASGNVLVTGYTGANQSADVLTLKLNGDTGS